MMITINKIFYFANFEYVKNVVILLTFNKSKMLVILLTYFATFEQVKNVGYFANFRQVVVLLLL